MTITALRSPQDERPWHIGIMSFDPFDGGFIQTSNYWMRFWWPVLGTIPAALYQQLLVYSRPGDTHQSHVSVRTLATTIGCDTRTLTGRFRDGKYTPGAIAILQQAGLLAVELEHTPAGVRRYFHVERRPPLLTVEQAAKLPRELQTAHDEWLKANIRSMGTPGTPVGTPITPVGTPTRTPIQKTSTGKREKSPTREFGVKALPDAQNMGEDRPSAVIRKETGLAYPLVEMWEDLLDTVSETISQDAAARLSHLEPLDLAGGVLAFRCPDDEEPLWQSAYSKLLQHIVHRWPTAITSIQVLPFSKSHHTQRRFEP